MRSIIIIIFNLAAGLSLALVLPWLSDPSYIDGGGNIDPDPIFVTPVNPAIAPNNIGDLHLQENSPARDAGDNIFVSVLTDLDGNFRIANAIVDMGAFEHQIDYAYSIYQPLILK